MHPNTSHRSIHNPPELSVRRALRLYARGARLNCPHCGAGPLATRSWFRLKRRCPGCGLRTERGEEDFFLGAMMFNLVLAEGLLALLLLGVVLAFWPAVPWTPLYYTGIAMMTVAPFALYPFSHTIWLASDILIRPVTEEEMQWHRTHAEDEFRSIHDR